MTTEKQWKTVTARYICEVSALHLRKKRSFFHPTPANLPIFANPIMMIHSEMMYGIETWSKSNLATWYRATVWLLVWRNGTLFASAPSWFWSEGETSLKDLLKQNPRSAHSNRSTTSNIGGRTRRWELERSFIMSVLQQREADKLGDEVSTSTY